MNKNDWRLTNQTDYLYNEELELKDYVPMERWDHDHCEFCGETIDVNSPKAYATKDNYYWICRKCFEDFKEIFCRAVIDQTKESKR